MEDALFWAKVDKQPDGCWVWTGARAPYGYGRLTRNYRGWLAHRRSWWLLHGSLPQKGYDLDHLCRNPPCVNPDHLELVTHQENNRRGDFSKRGKSATCMSGHAWTPESTRLTPTGRSCRICTNARVSAWRKAKRRTDPQWRARELARKGAQHARRMQDPEYRERLRLRAEYYNRLNGHQPR